MNMEKLCKKHGLTNFTLRKDGRWRCCKCNVEAVQKRRDAVKEKAVAYKGGKCQNPKCGYDRYVGALDFHHVDQSEKDFTIAAKGYTRSWESVRNEIDKCIMLCANCHREAHAGILAVSEIDPSLHNVVSNRVKEESVCVDCGVKIEKDAVRCAKCHALSKRKVVRPELDVLLNDIKEIGYLGTGRKYGVSDNSIRKWIKQYNKSGV